MSRARVDLDANLKLIMKDVGKMLKKHSFKQTFGAELPAVGDYLCEICQNILGSPFGIVFSSSSFPGKSLCNIFMEKGLMLGFGKPVILFVDNKANIPTDFNRDYVVRYDKRNYLRTFEKAIEKIKKLPKYYYNIVGECALDAHDYEKAGKYFKEAYLISGSDPSKKIKKLIKILKSKKLNVEGFKKRLFDDINAFSKSM